MCTVRNGKERDNGLYKTSQSRGLVSAVDDQAMSLYDERLAKLDLTIDGYDLVRHERAVSSGFTRVTTEIVLSGLGKVGRGEDVTYDAPDHDDYPAQLGLGWAGTLHPFLRRLSWQPLFAREPARPASRQYRRWAFESAALDLALRQSGLSLGEALGLAYRPVRFVVAATGSVRIVDFKAYYGAGLVANPPDPRVYEAVLAAFPQAVVEDAATDGDTAALTRAAARRLSWDAPIHSWADVEALPLPARHLNIKPSRFGTLRALIDCIERARGAGVSLYGGGQFAADRSRRWPASFTPTAPTTSRPSATTSRRRARACRQARWRLRFTSSASASTPPDCAASSDGAPSPHGAPSDACQDRRSRRPPARLGKMERERPRQATIRAPGPRRHDDSQHDRRRRGQSSR